MHARRVLLAEGDRATSDFFASSLREAGYSVDIAADGLETIGRIEATAYDAILLDLHLTRVDGMGVLRFVAGGCVGRMQRQERM